MSQYGLVAQVDRDGSLTALPGYTFQKIAEKLDTNPRDSDWRALIRAAEDKYHIRPAQIELWSPAINGLRSAASRALTELSSQGMTVAELIEYLDRLGVDTYPLGLSKYEGIRITQQPDTHLDVSEGGQIVIEVKATGRPFPRYQWFFCKDGLNEFESLLGRTDSVLQINNVMSENAGTYACQIHNHEDADKTKITNHTYVSVSPAPHEPVSVSPAPHEPDTMLKDIEDGKADGAVINILRNLVSPSPHEPDTMLKDIEDDKADGAVINILRNLAPFQSPDDNRLLDSYLQRSTVVRNSLITKHPSDLTVNLDEEIVLYVETCGDPPISYEWFRNGQPIGFHTNKLRIPNATSQDFGNYYCVVKNGLVKEESDTAHVKERFPSHEQMRSAAADIILVAQPKSATVKFGGSIIFVCEAKCSLPLQYQWFKDGAILPGETSCECKIINIQDRRCEGMYQCEVRVDTRQAGHTDIPRRLTSVAYLNVSVPNYNENIEYNPADKVALLIGNYDYRNEQPLTAPSSDVSVLSEIFRSLQFRVVSLLNLTKPEIENAVEEFCNLVEKNVYAVFYFCGHGFEENGISYLVPTDAPAAYRAEECVRVDGMLEKIQRNQPSLIFMIIDICRKCNKVVGNSIPHHIPKTPRGNTVFCYATSQDLNAYEAKRRGLLVGHLEPILRRPVGIEALIGELKEEFGRHSEHSKIQIPELRSNLSEPRRSLTDRISTKGQTQAFRRRQLIWDQAHVKPEKQEFMFRDLGVRVELDFQSDFSNVLNVFATVKNKGITAMCRADIFNVPQTVSRLIPKLCRTDDVYITTTTIQDIQKLQDNLTVDLIITYIMPGDQIQRRSVLNMDLGMPLVSKLKLWRQPSQYLPIYREPTEQADETDSL